MAAVSSTVFAPTKSPSVGSLPTFLKVSVNVVTSAVWLGSMPGAPIHARCSNLNSLSCSLEKYSAATAAKTLATDVQRRILSDLVTSRPPSVASFLRRSCLRSCSSMRRRPATSLLKSSMFVIPSPDSD